MTIFHDLHNLSQNELEKLFRLAVGNRPASRTYYDKFNRYLERGAPLLSFDVGGLLFGFLWFAYRKIWPPLIPAFLLFISIQLFGGDRTISYMIIWLVSGSFFGGFFGRQIYFWWILTFINNAIQRGVIGPALEDLVRREFGTVSDSVRLRR